MTIQEAVAKFHDETLVSKSFHVHHVYNDGEITMQKAMELYGHRIEHQMWPPAAECVPAEWFPMKRAPYGYAIVTREGAETIRKLIKEYTETKNTPLEDFAELHNALVKDFINMVNKKLED